MSDSANETDAGATSRKSEEKPARQARLEAQLRANLQRRKAQARARKDDGPGDTAGPRRTNS